MFEKSVFENLKSTRDRAYQAVRFAREEKDRSGKELSKIREKLNDAWAKVDSAKNKKNQEWNLISSVQTQIDREWEVYKDLKNSTSRDIDYAKSQQEHYHEESQRLFKQASDAYNYGDKSMAPYYSAQAKEARENRNYWSGEVRRLIDYTRSIQKPTNSVNRTAFNVARDELYRAKEEYSKIKQEFDEAKEIHENNLNNFNRCKDELGQAKKAVDDYRIAGQKESERIKTENDNRWAELERIAQEAELKYSGSREMQYIDNDAKVMVKSGYDRRHHCVVTDILITDRRSDNGLRLHLLIDENGKEIHRHVRDNKRRL
jgi:domain of unknown function (DUF1771)